MKQFTEKTFAIPKLTGISEKTITEHIKLYAGYVKHANHILDRMHTLSKEQDTYSYELSELQRRFSFEWCGMRNHEFYFESFVGGSKELSEESALRTAIENEFGSFDTWLAQFKAIALTRGVGWAMLYYDKKTERLVHAWVDEQHIGQLVDASPVLALDMWEHSFVADYQPSGKKQYVEDFFTNLNWETIEKNYTSVA